VIAAAVIYFTASILNVELPQGSRMKWWEAFDVEFSDIEGFRDFSPVDYFRDDFSFL